MTKHPRARLIQDLAVAKKGAATCLYLARPKTEANNDKRRILKKNALAALDTDGDRAEGIAKALEAWEVSDFRGNGVAFIERDGDLETAHLTSRPVPTLWRGEDPYLLPLIADIESRNAAWVLALDRRQARLFIHADERLEDATDRLASPSYEDVESARSVQDDVFFHSSGAQRSGPRSGAPVYHALGADQSQERDKTDEAYYRQVIDALNAVIPKDAGTLELFGDPSTVGPFAKLLETGGVEARQHHLAGDALEPERILEALAAIEPDHDEADARETEPARIKAALDIGRVETLFCTSDIAGLAGARGTEDLSLRTNADEPNAAELNALALEAVRSGAGVRIVEPGALGGAAVQAARMRW